MLADSEYIAIIYFLGLSILSHFISRRSIAEASAWKGIVQSATSWPRLCVLLIFVDSWAFLFASGFITLAIGLEENARVCAAAIYLCICFYTTSKLFIYAFLSEKVHIVWSAPGTPRFHSKVFLGCFTGLIAYLLVIIATLFGRIHDIKDDVCVIGLKPWSSFPLLSYDLVANAVLTGLFIWPLKRNTNMNPRLKRVARRTLVAAFFALTCSTANIAVLAALHGKEPGWVCLACCSADVLVNAFAIYWATGISSEGRRYTVTTFPEDGHGDQNAPVVIVNPKPDHRFSVTTTQSRHVVSPVSPSGGRSAIGKLIYPRGATSSVGDDSVITIQTHTFSSNAIVRSHSSRLTGSSEYVRDSDHGEQDIDEEGSFRGSMTCEDEIIGAAFAEEQEQSIPRPPSSDKVDPSRT